MSDTRLDVRGRRTDRYRRTTSASRIGAGVWSDSDDFWGHVIANVCKTKRLLHALEKKYARIGPDISREFDFTIKAFPCSFDNVKSRIKRLERHSKVARQLSQVIDTLETLFEDEKDRRARYVPDKRCSQHLDVIMHCMHHYTGNHDERVSVYAVIIALHAGFSGETIKRIKWAGLIHDIGKIAVTKEVIDSPSKFTDEDWAVMKQHVDIGAKILRASEVSEQIVAAVRCHHECYDGTGYNKGLRKDEIPKEAQILKTADIFDAWTSARKYHRMKNNEVFMLSGRAAIEAVLDEIARGKISPELREPLQGAAPYLVERLDELKVDSTHEPDYQNAVLLDELPSIN